jgi:hypothetical protein
MWISCRETDLSFGGCPHSLYEWQIFDHSRPAQKNVDVGGPARAASSIPRRR